MCVQKHCLQSFSVRRCTKLSDAALAEVAARGGLVHVMLSGCTGTGAATMAALASACKDSLESLDVSFCR